MLNKINIILENTEVITIDGKHILQFLSSPIDNDGFSNAIYLKISKQADIIYSSFANRNNLTVFERLTQHHDIAQIEVWHNDILHSHFWIDYLLENTSIIGSANINQYDHFDTDSNLTISIQDNSQTNILLPIRLSKSSKKE